MTISENDLKDPLYWTRWSMNSGLFTQKAKDTLYGYAYLAHQEVKAAEVSIDVQSKTVVYSLYLSKRLFSAVEVFRVCVKSGGIINLWRARRKVRKFGNLEFDKILSEFVSKLCGADWKTITTIRPEDEYVDAGRDEQTRSNHTSHG